MTAAYLLTVAQAAEHAATSPDTIRRAIRSSDPTFALPAKTGPAWRGYRIKRADVEAWADRQADA